MRNKKFLKIDVMLWLFVVSLTGIVNSHAETTANDPVANEHGTIVTSNSGKMPQGNPEVSPGSTEQVTEKHPNYVTYSTEPTVEKVKILGLELKVADIIALIVVLVGIMTFAVTLVPLIAVFYGRNAKEELQKYREEVDKHFKEQKELNKEQVELSKVPTQLQSQWQEEHAKHLKNYDRKFERAFDDYNKRFDQAIGDHSVQIHLESDRQSGRHEERLYHTELVLQNLWVKRDSKIQADLKTETFLREFAAHLKDSITFRELLLPDQKAILSALGTLKGREDLPKEIVTLLRLLYKQGRLKDAGVLSAAREIVERFDERLTDVESKST
ncbi:MAG: hypothetical protein BWK78_02130 [Thiotrichaceae bacterium IS1]|nr:MAG: hypothetical protein BWK78_02130 [Thiotrichaceae bacterium IS1]